MGTRLRRFPWLLALSLCLWPATVAAWSGKVIGVIDGDSIRVLHDGRQEQIRLWGIDCPEKHVGMADALKELNNSWGNPPEADKAGTRARAPSPRLSPPHIPPPPGLSASGGLIPNRLAKSVSETPNSRAAQEQSKSAQA